MINIIELYNSNVLNYTNTGINGQNYLDFFAMLRASIYESVPSVLTTTLTFPSLLTLIPGLVVLLVLGAFIVIILLAMMNHHTLSLIATHNKSYLTNLPLIQKYK